MNDAIRLEVPRVGPSGHDPMWDSKAGRHYDRRGNLITLREWVGLLEFAVDYRILKQEYVGDYWVSTVWLGLDHSFGGGAPLIFETMVFNHTMPHPPPFPSAPIGSDEFEEWSESYPNQTSASDLDAERYSTEEQALEGHKRMVDKVRLIVAVTDGIEQEKS